MNWSQDRVVLQNTVGKDLLARFTFGSNSDGVVRDGIYFDDFKVTVIDMTYNGVDPTGQIFGFISNPMPNPSTAGLTINYQLPGNDAGNASFQLFDSRGIMVKELPVTSSAGNIKFNVTDLPAGVYLYRISGNFGNTAIKKLVVAH